jgi:hypothetical protein
MQRGIEWRQGQMWREIWTGGQKLKVNVLDLQESHQGGNKQLKQKKVWRRGRGRNANEDSLLEYERVWGSREKETIERVET